MGFGTFAIFDTMFMVIFLLVFGMIIVTFVRGIGEWNKNNHSPRLTVPATVVTKRTNVTRHHHHSGQHHHHRISTSTTYYATFQVDSGDRMELSLSGEEYGLLAEGDRGELAFQGTRYLGFERICDHS